MPTFINYPEVKRKAENVSNRIFSLINGFKIEINQYHVERKNIL